MKNKTALLLLLFAMLAYNPADILAQEVKNFKLTNVMNNETVSLDSYPSCEGMVLIFTSNSCPYDQYYRERIAQLAKAYQDRVPVLLVNSLAEPAESLQQMVAKGKTWSLTIPYLADKDQTLMTSLDVRKTPEAFLLKNINGKFTIVYRGAIDDNAQVEADVRHRYLRDAIDIMLNNQKIQTPDVRPVGCNLKRKA
ncbi:MAG TPA: redoxin domain-containing protein [Chryseosolibacter sp.]|nr:redoxin domain-containing protein [Chryseosolibacter sp.]